MATTSRRAAQTTVTLRAGPWKGVRDTPDPFDDQSFLVDASNAYLPDPAEASGFYVRAGTQILANENAFYSANNAFGQEIHSHEDANGNIYNFAIAGGKVFRVTTSVVRWDTFTDVTPIGATINSTTAQTIKMLSVGPDLIVSDGINTPWIATDLGSTPITATLVQYNPTSDPWSATDMTEYGGSVFYLLNQVAGVSRPFDLSWTEPGQPTIGLEQTNFDDNWTVIQQSNDPLTAIAGTNISLFYFRRASIGRITGSVGPNLASTATHDSAAYNVGTLTRDSIQVFGNTVFFTDAVGRPNSIAVYGQAPTPIWKQLRGLVDRTTAVVNASVTALITRSAIEPTQNLYLIGVWSSAPASFAAPLYMLAFDAFTGTYVGRWTFSPEACGTWINENGARQLVMIPATNLPSATPRFLIAAALRTTDDANVWIDGPVINNMTVQFTFTTGRLGFDLDGHFVGSSIVALLGGPLQTNLGISTFANTPMSLVIVGAGGQLSGDGMVRYTTTTETQGKGIQIFLQGNLPSVNGTATSIQQVQLKGVLLPAAPEDV